MKVALLLTGYLRTFDQNVEQLYNSLPFISELDIYCSTWNTNEPKYRQFEQIGDIKEALLRAYPNLKDFNISNQEYYNEKKKPIKLLDRDNDIFKTNKRAAEHGSFWVERLRDQWYLVKEGFKLIPDNYDIVIKTRFDLVLHHFNLVNRNGITIPFNNHHEGYTDHLAYGSYDDMMMYCNLYDHVNHMYRAHNVDISYAEKMLKFYLEEYSKINVTLDRDNINYTLNK